MKLIKFNKIKDSFYNKDVKVTLYGNKEIIGHYIETNNSPIIYVDNEPIRIKDIKNIEVYNDNRIYKYVLVNYVDLDSYKTYSYKTTLKNINEGDYVLVDCNGDIEEAEVEEIRYCRRDEAPWPPEKTKDIIEVIDEFDEPPKDYIEIEEKYDYDKTRFCPKCNNTKLIKILYGTPSHDELLKASKGEIYLGGRDMSLIKPCFYCPECHLSYYEDLSDEVTISKLGATVINKLKSYVSIDLDDMFKLFSRCINIKEALSNTLDYLNDKNTSKKVNDLYVKIFNETHHIIIKHLIKDQYEYFIDSDEDILVRLDLETGEYKIFSVEINEGNINKKWFKVEEYDPKMYDIVSNYDFNKLDKIEYQEDIDKYIDDFIKDIKQ